MAILITLVVLCHFDKKISSFNGVLVCYSHKFSTLDIISTKFQQRSISELDPIIGKHVDHIYVERMWLICLRF